MCKRDNNLDLLKLICSFSVVLIHVNFYFFRDIYLIPTLSADYLFLSIINIISRFSIPCFLMITGAFLLNKDFSDIKNYYVKGIKKIFIPSFFLIIVFSLIFLFKGNGFKALLYSLIDGSLNNLWYLYVYFLIYLLIPGIAFIKNNISDRLFEYISYILVFWAVISNSTSIYYYPFDMGVVFSFMSYVILGNVLYNKLKNNKINNKNKVFIILVSCLLVIITFLFRMFIYSNEYFIRTYYSNIFSPTITLYSILFFCLFININVNKSFYKYTSYSFYVYLFHPIIYESILSVPIIKETNHIICIIFVTVLTFVISFIFSIMYKYIYNYFFNVFIKEKKNN